MKIENYVKKYRQESKLTQIKLAKIVGVSRQSIYAIETQKSEPSLLLAFRLAMALEVSIEKLFVLKISQGNEDDDTIPSFSIF